MKRAWIFGGTAFLVGLLAGCGGPFNIGPEVSYSLGRQYTSETSNVFQLNFDTIGNDFQMILTGEGFEADVPMNQKTNLVSAITVTYEDEGVYVAGLEILRPDGISFFKTNFQWEYSTKIPRTPLVTPTDSNVNSERIELGISSATDPDTREIIVFGDVEDGEDYWRDIPETLYLHVKTTKPDGFKTISVQTRNKFGNVSEVKEVEIFKKSTPPRDCQVELTAPHVRDKVVRLWLSGVNDGPLFWKAIGNGIIRMPRYEEFTGSTQSTLTLTPGEGDKEFRVAVRDQSHNFCDFFDFKITYDREYITKSIHIKDTPIWVGEREQVLVVQYDHLPEDDLQIWIEGEVRETEYTHQWVPWQNEVPIVLDTNEGTTVVRIRFKLNGVEESGRLRTSVFHNPKIYYFSNTGKISLSKIPTLATVTVTGCSETYQGIPSAGQLPCSATGGTTITVIYTLEDGETITRSVQVPL